MTDHWAIMEYEKGRHAAVPNSLCRYGISCVIPMVTEFNPGGRLAGKRPADQMRPALSGIAFVPADETKVQFAMAHIRYVERVWRHQDGRRSETGELIVIPDKHLQYFLDGLDKREKKPVRAKKAMNLAEMAEQDWFATYANLYGLQAAIKRFGSDLRENIAA